MQQNTFELVEGTMSDRPKRFTYPLTEAQLHNRSHLDDLMTEIQRVVQQLRDQGFGIRGLWIAESADLGQSDGCRYAFEFEALPPGYRDPGK